MSMAFTDTILNSTDSVTFEFDLMVFAAFNQPAEAGI